MRSTESWHYANPTPLEVVVALRRYGIEVAQEDVVCVELQSLSEPCAFSVSTDGCELVELMTDETILDYPDCNCEVEHATYYVFNKTSCVQKEMANGYLASA